MEHKRNNPEFKESSDKIDLVRMQPEIALLSSMQKSKTLTLIVIIGILGFAGFLYFLYKMA
ncbi:hypothetical protein J7384_16715 [Endozoicomonas sp. G2_1]|uniref:hypothetical protein n=1 Tax=Endozoicomonas sp. G2_1 TaxID=2821091 RepID=UPI001ADB9C5B|nr:hypothetical protein [Endozoicomonas sp. G2_1]MBO9492005.1 hypothetical protein [Endozoicomonas sp. G2_1]